MSLRSTSAVNLGSRRISSAHGSGLPTPNQNHFTGNREQSIGNTLPTGGFSPPKGERRPIPNSLGNQSPMNIMRGGTNVHKIDQIDEENSDNEGDGGGASMHLKKNNYDKSKKK